MSAGDRVGQGQRVGVESGAGDQVRVLRAVGASLRPSGPAMMGHVDPELVGAAVSGLQLTKERPSRWDKTS